MSHLSSSSRRGLRSKPSTTGSSAAVQVSATLDGLVRLQFEAREFSLLPTQPVESLLSGRHASRLRGRGLMFEELRDYRPGDDIRTMDWRATARLRRAHVRVYSEERERPVLLVVDQRSSMFFGSARTTKATAAAELAALAAWRTLHAGDRVGAVIFGDDELVEIRPHRSQQNVMRICSELVRHNQRLSADRASNPAMLNEALRRAANVAKHDYLVVLVTDYDGDDPTTQKIATRLAAHNDVLAALVYDPLGIDLAPRHSLQATDGRQQVRVETDAKSAQRFSDQFRARCDQLRQRLRSIRIPILPICTHDPVIDQVLHALGNRR
jgi:uncharacterized protein (DUF58 family)